MALSGVKPDPSISEKYKQLKLRKEYGYLFLKIQGDKIVISAEGKKGATHTDFISALKKETDCCYAIFDGNKVGLFAWNPDTASPKSKMLLASTSEALTSSLDGVGQAIGVSDADEVSEKLKEKGII